MKSPRLTVEEASFELFTEENIAIRGDLATPSEPEAPVVVCVHGFKGFKDWGFWPQVARRMTDPGYACLRFNFSHSGIGPEMENFSETDLFETGTFSREVADLRMILRALAGKRVRGSEDISVDRIGLLAHSRGSVSALAAAASGEFPIRSVVLWNPVSSVLWWDEKTRREWREKGFWEVSNSRTGQIFRVRTALLDDAEKNSAALDPISNARRLTVPLLVVVGAEDESVPPDSGRKIARAAGREAFFFELPSTGHTFGAKHPPSSPGPALESAIGATMLHFDRTLSGRKPASQWPNDRQ